MKYTKKSIIKATIFFSLIIVIVLVSIKNTGKSNMSSTLNENNYVTNETIAKMIETVDNIEIQKKEQVKTVYNNITMDELIKLLNKHLNSTISNKGSLIASYSLKNKVDPILATAIILHETGCKWTCSYLVRKCNNVGGVKGSPGCSGMSSYKKYDSIDEGIKHFIRNLKNNYYAYGLDTAKKMQKKYCGSDSSWADKVNKYIKEIKGN